MFRLTTAAAFLLSLMALSLCTGCTGNAHDPANQAAISNRQRVKALWDGYTAADRTVDQLFRSGTLSRADATTARDVLRTTVRPLIETAQDALVNGNSEAAIANAERALAGILASLDAKRATTRPAVLRLEEGHRVPPSLAA